MKIIDLSLLLIATVFLNACMSDSSSQPARTVNSITTTTATTQVNTAPQNVFTATPSSTIPTTTLAAAPAPVQTTTAPATPTYIAPPAIAPPVAQNPPANNTNMLRIWMHYGLLQGQPHLWNEAGNSQQLYLTQYASAGSTSIQLNSTAGLIQQQLITYIGRNNEYYTTQIQSMQNNTVQLSIPLQDDVYAGAHAWNFYYDASHPNWAGFNAIADFSIRQLGWSRLNQGKHVLFGDSWFSSNMIFERLQTRLPGASFSNKGVGGNNSWDLQARFDADVSWQNPDYVWIMTGTNDYWQDVSTANYKSNMRQLINRVRDLGAIPIVFDSSVGPLHFNSDWKTRLSQSYATAIDELAAE